MTITGPLDVVIEHGGDLVEQTSAMFSADRAYRYVLRRTWSAHLPLTCIGLNPSTADHLRTDPTISRMRRRAVETGHGGLVMLNLFAIRATHPHQIRSVPDPVGPANDDVIRDCLRPSGLTVVCAWGAHSAVEARAATVLAWVAAAGHAPLCLGTTAAGHPRHPLYVRADQPLIPLVEAA